MKGIQSNEGQDDCCKKERDECCNEGQDDCCKKERDECCNEGQDDCSSSKQYNGFFHKKGKIWWKKVAIFLGVFTVIYNIIEGVISVIFSVSDGSLGLLAFGIDSIIEVFSGCLVLWRYTGKEKLSLIRERTATIIIGFMLTILGVASVASAIYDLVKHNSPSSTVPGILITAFSILIMTALYISKRNASRALNSATLASDAKCSLSCIKLSLVVFFGSGIFWIDDNLWWIDSAVAIVIATMIGVEGALTTQYACSKKFSGGCCCESTPSDNKFLNMLNWLA